MMRDKLVVILGQFMHEDRTLAECFLKLADIVGMGMVMAVIVYCVLG